MGVKQEGLYFWRSCYQWSKDGKRLPDKWILNLTSAWENIDGGISAFTVAELFDESMDETSLEKATDGENTYYICKLDIKSGLKFTDINPANALAKMKVCLIEYKLL